MRKKPRLKKLESELRLGGSQTPRPVTLSFGTQQSKSFVVVEPRVHVGRLSAPHNSHAEVAVAIVGTTGRASRRPRYSAALQTELYFLELSVGSVGQAPDQRAAVVGRILGLEEESGTLGRPRGVVTQRLPQRALLIKFPEGGHHRHITQLDQNVASCHR